ncbi:MAG TPA: hypothetical protein VMV75_11370 [Sulfuricella sp.]|nr:hypothetical protein [Sulfuricella sp.]
MTDQIQILVDRDVYSQLQTLMVPPISDANAVIRELLFQDGHTSRAAAALETAEQHFTYEQELERSIQGVYECGGGT